jgi:hypothetical protein
VVLLYKYLNIQGNLFPSTQLKTGGLPLVQEPRGESERKSESREGVERGEENGNEKY